MFSGGYIDARVMARDSAVSWKISDTDNGWIFAKIWTRVWMTEMNLRNLNLLGSDITILSSFLLHGTEKRQNDCARETPTEFSRVRHEHFNGDKFHWSEIATWQLSNLTWIYLSSSTSRHNFRIFHLSFIFFVVLVGFTIRFLCVPKSILMVSLAVW